MTKVKEITNRTPLTAEKKKLLENHMGSVSCKVSLTDVLHWYRDQNRPE